MPRKHHRDDMSQVGLNDVTLESHDTINNNGDTGDQIETRCRMGHPLVPQGSLLVYFLFSVIVSFH